MESRKLFLPMRNREYCLTDSEQKHLARTFVLDVSCVRNAMIDLRSQIESGEVGLGRTPSAVKRQIQDKLNAERQRGSGRLS